MNRREFIVKTATTSVAAAFLGTTMASCRSNSSSVTWNNLPRWKGFNLLEKFIATNRNDPFSEADFALMAEWGFNFVRLPMSYWCWSDPSDWRVLKEDKLKEIDQAVHFGKQYGVHVCLNFHRGPGYSVDRSANEPFNLWVDEEAQMAFNYHWEHFARRYKGIPNEQVSFNLLNEPATMTNDRKEVIPDATYIKVCKSAADAIRDIDPNRLIIADGLWWGREPVPGLVDLQIAQSTRGYDPMQVSHYHASWVTGAEDWPLPTWPITVKSSPSPNDNDPMRAHYLKTLARDGVSPDSEWNSARLKKQLIDPWRQLTDQGSGVIVGECGAYNQTPHDVVLAWMRDLLTLWKAQNWGYALWNLRGAFGIVNSNRADVTYENYKGVKVDRKYLELLQEF